MNGPYTNHVLAFFSVGLKKLGKTVECSYSNIQTLALKNLQSASNALLYHLNDLSGMAKWYERFGVLGLSETAVAECLKVLGSLMMKTQELFSVIESALRNFTAFFKWLYLVILQLLEEDVPAFVKRFNQEDVSLIAEFLHCQLACGGGAGGGGKGKPRFSMERVGRYLEKEPLTFTIDHSANAWEKFLESSPEVKSAPFIFSACPEKSLATLHDELNARIHAAFRQLPDATEQALSCNLRVTLFKCTGDEKQHVVAQNSVDGGSHHWVVISNGITPSDSFYALRLRSDDKTAGVVVAEGVSVGFQELAGRDAHAQCNVHVIDLAFYNEKTLTVLLRRDGPEAESCEDTLAQFDLASLESSRFEPWSFSTGRSSAAALDEIRVDGTRALAQRRNLARMKALRVAVSGSRKVACVLSESRTRVKIFDMDAEEEDAEESSEELHTSAMSTDSSV